MRPGSSRASSHGTYHEISKPQTTEDALKKLEKLNGFLATVKDDARVRAKEENGVTFLHTRTGTVFGRFIKWLTAGWPEAVEQRIKARKLIVDILLKIPTNSPKSSEIKNKILDEALEMDLSDDFDTKSLKEKINDFWIVVRSEKNQNNKSSSENQPKNKPESDQSTNDSVNKFSYFNSSNAKSDSLLIDSDNDEDNESETTSLSKESIEPKTPPPAPTADIAPISSIDDMANDPGNAITPGHNDKPTESLQPIAAELSNPVQPESESAYLNSSAENKNENKIPAKPIEENKVNEEKKLLFGCKVITESWSTSVRSDFSKSTIGNYYADTYILPAAEKSPEFKFGSVKSGATEILKENLEIVSSVHHYHDEKRSIKNLLMHSKNNKSGDMIKTMSAEDQKKYLDDLKTRYANALSHAADNGAKTIALSPLREKSPILTQEEIGALASAISEFQNNHANVKIHIVFTNTVEPHRFNDAMKNLGRSQ